MRTVVKATTFDGVGTPTTIRLDELELERVKRLAKATRRRQSDLLRYALELGLDQLEREENNRRANRTEV